MTTEIDYASHMTEVVDARIQAETKAGKKRSVDQIEHLLDIAKMLGRMMTEDDAVRRDKEPEMLITEEKQVKARIAKEVNRIFELADVNPEEGNGGSDGDSADRIGKMEEKQRLRNEQLAEKKKTKKGGK